MKNTTGLRQYVQEKRREAEQRVDEAIHELVTRGEAVTFYRIAAVADVSKSYLYTRANCVSGLRRCVCKVANVYSRELRILRATRHGRTPW